MLKIIQISDCHLVGPNRKLFTLDPFAQLRAAIADINAHHGDAALCILTGDLANDGELEAYELLAEALSALKVPYRLLPGNHDDRKNMRKVFPHIETDEAGHLQSVVPTQAGHIFLLDTIEPGVHHGVYDAPRCHWLRTELARCGNDPVLVFAHHPIGPIGMPRLDQYMVLENEGIWRAIRSAGNVRHWFFGHVHRPVSGQWKGLAFSSLRGTNHQNALDLNPGRKNISSLEAPSYAVILADEETIIVHQHEFQDTSARFIYDPDAPQGEQIKPVARSEMALVE